MKPKYNQQRLINEMNTLLFMFDCRGNLIWDFSRPDRPYQLFTSSNFSSGKAWFKNPKELRRAVNAFIFYTQNWVEVEKIRLEYHPLLVSILPLQGCITVKDENHHYYQFNSVEETLAFLEDGTRIIYGHIGEQVLGNGL